MVFFPYQNKSGEERVSRDEEAAADNPPLDPDSFQHDEVSPDNSTLVCNFVYVCQYFGIISPNHKSNHVCTCQYR